MRKAVEAALASVIADAGDEVTNPEELLEDALDAVMTAFTSAPTQKMDVPPQVAATAAHREALKKAADALLPFATFAQHVVQPDSRSILLRVPGRQQGSVTCADFRNASRALADVRAAL